MALKRKKVTLTIAEKLQLISRCEAGENRNKLAQEYGIGKQTLSDIYKSKEKLLEFSKCVVSGIGPSQRKSMKKSTFKELDVAMIKWVKQRKGAGVTTSGPDCILQAKRFHSELGFKGEFRASNGWLKRFKQRYGIDSIPKQETCQSNEFSPQESVFSELQELLSREKFSNEQIYCACEMELRWKHLPEEALRLHKKKKSSQLNSSKDYVTAVCCANVIGDHKLKLLIVGKPKKPSPFYGTALEKFPVSYYSHPRALLNEEIFKVWFHEEFVPEVQRHLIRKGMSPKALLIMEGTSTCTLGGMISNDNLVSVKQLPITPPSSKLPNLQGLTTSLKQNYMSRMSNLVTKEDFLELWNQMTLMDAANALSLAWDDVKTSTFVLSWNNLLSKLEEESGDLSDDLCDEKLDAFLDSMEGIENVTQKNLKAWLEEGREHFNNVLESDATLNDKLDKVNSLRAAASGGAASLKDGICSSQGVAQTVDMECSSGLLEGTSGSLNSASIDVHTEMEKTVSNCREICSEIEKNLKGTDIKHSTALRCIDTILDYMNQCKFHISDILAVKKIRCTVKMIAKTEMCDK